MKINKGNVIEIKNLSKVFHIPHEQRGTLAESIIGMITKGKVRYEKLYALRNLSLNVRKGEFLGIIGPNGSGKTTLLKVVAGILEPEKGSIEVIGKVVPFLELGIGFVQELTAKENIYLYGSLLGLTKKDIDAKFRKIVNFAEIKKFIDTPLKDFSTGMLARLAFSIAKEVDGDIYLIDEVLAVGDEEFQKKCLKVFKELKEKRKTILFVTHNTDLVKQICEKTIYLDTGRVIKRGKTSSVIQAYNRKTASKEKVEDNKIIKETKQSLKDKQREIELLQQRIYQKGEYKKKTRERQRFFEGTKEWGKGKVLITHAKVLDKSDNEIKKLETGEYVKIRIFYKARERIVKPEVGIAIFDNQGLLIAGPNTHLANKIFNIDKGERYIDYIIDKLNLLEGKYFVHAAISKAPCKGMESNYTYRADVASFEVINKSSPQRNGIVALNGRWGI